jgi:hypothetical protein
MVSINNKEIGWYTFSRDVYIHVASNTVSSSFSAWGCFLRVERSSSEDLPPLSLACGWPLSANGSLYCEWWRLHELRVEDPSGARKGGRTDAGTGPGRPAQAHPGPARLPLRSRGSSGIYALCPVHLHYFDDVILASKMEVLLAWSPVFYTSIPEDVPS